jgi:hypothetical protein
LTHFLLPFHTVSPLHTPPPYPRRIPRWAFQSFKH